MSIAVAIHVVYTVVNSILSASPVPESCRGTSLKYLLV